MKSSATSNWRFRRHDAQDKYTCRALSAGLYRLTDLNGHATLLRRCACAGNMHVLNEESPLNAADVQGLKPTDFVDPRDRIREPNVGGSYTP